MHFYPHNIPDFNNSTRHLTRVQRSVYRDAIELYYDKEKHLDVDICKLEKRLLCVNDEEKDALKYILEEFFIKTDEGYFHERCDAEILKYRKNTTAKAIAGIASAQSKKERKRYVQQNSTDVQQPLNSVQQTNNQELITNNYEIVKEKINKKEKTDLDSFPETQKSFNIFWNLYPKKTGKAEALKSWRKKKPDIDKVVSSLRWQVESQQWKQGFIPNPSTYINQERWDDEPQKEIIGTVATLNKAESLYQRNLDAVKNWVPPEMRGKNGSV